MAERVLFNIAAGIINSLAPFVAGEIGLLWGVQDELEKLQNTVSTIKDVLLDAGEKQTGSNAVSGWLGRLSDLFYQADDLLDEISTEAQQQELMTRDKKAKKVRIFFSTSNQLVYGLKMGHKIKEIREKFDVFAADITKFNFLVRLEEATTSYKKRVDTHSYLGGEMVIGRDDDKKKVMGHVMKSHMEADVSIISIVGLGGLGKTTLAKLIFDDEEIQNNFEVKLWVCVSDNFEAKVIIKRILESIKGVEPSTNQMEILVRGLREEIDGKKYLLILDDLWNENCGKWDELKIPLMGGGKGSKILVTTRKENVANIIQSEICHLNYLGEGASWELFKKVAFENGIVSEGLEEIGKVILKKCRGVPLAMKTVGKLLYSKSLDNWREFINKELPKIPQEATDILPTLKLSYDDLPSYLKHCFAYCSIFRKDYVFNKIELINLWIAQGYVKSKENQCLEKIGHEHFMNLFSRSFFQEPEIDDFGDIIKCKMHDLMHDLAILVAKPLISTFPFENGIDPNKIRHIMVMDEEKLDSSILTSLCRARMPRTFIVDVYYEIDWEVISKHFKFLRVLSFRTKKLKCVLSSIGKLRHLRHLDLFYNQGLKKLPSSITTLVNLRLLDISQCPVRNLPLGFGQLVNLRRFDASSTRLMCLPLEFGQLVNLRHFDASRTKLTCLPYKMCQLTNLETLDLSNCRSLKELPQDINKLVNLKQLNIIDCSKLSYMPSRLGQLTNLQVLTDFMMSSNSFSRDNSGLVELYGLNKLRGHLRIRGLSCGKAVLKEYEAANLMGKENLNSLSLAWSSEGVVNYCDDDVSLEGLQPHHNLKHLKLLGCWCPKHPSWLSLLTSLVSLSLESCNKWRSLAPLSKIPSLESLELEDMNDMEYLSHCREWSDYSQSSVPMTLFPSLKVIKLMKCPNLKGWWRDSIDKVESLHLSSASVKFFPSLKEMELKDCPNLMGWWGDSSVDVESLLLSSPLLSKLEIKDCPKLTSMPMFLHLERFLLKNGSWKPLPQRMTMDMSAAISSSALASSSCTALSKLKEIELNSITDLEVFLEEGLQSLTALEILRFKNCDKLKSLSPVIQHLKTVQYLFIQNCPLCEDDDNGMQWLGLKSLISLSFYNLPKLSSFPLGLQHVTTLEKLTISKCESLTTPSLLIQHLTTVEELCIEDCPICVDDETQWQGLKSLLSLSFYCLQQLSLPRGLQHITTLKKLQICFWYSLTTIPEEIRLCKSLEEFQIISCSNLASLPVGTREPWSLQRLTVMFCPILSQKCEREKGEYWPKIAHIPHLDLGGPPRKRKSGLRRMFRKFCSSDSDSDD